MVRMENNRIEFKGNIDVKYEVDVVVVGGGVRGSGLSRPLFSI